MGKCIFVLAIAASLIFPEITIAQPSLDVGINGVPGGTILRPDGPITIDVLLNTPIELDGAQYSLSANLNGLGPGSGDHLVTYDMVTPWTNGTVFMGLGLEYVQLIGVGGGNGATMALVNGMGPELYLKSFGYVIGAPLTGALLASYTIHVAPLNPGDQLVITAGADPANMYGNGYITMGGHDGGPWQPGIGLTIIPEPATLTLLLGAALLLRRRS